MKRAALVLLLLVCGGLLWWAGDSEENPADRTDQEFPLPPAQTSSAQPPSLESGATARADDSKPAHLSESSAAPKEPPTKEVFRIRVVADADGSAIEGARIGSRAWATRGTTGPDGRIAFDGPNGGLCLLTVRSPGYFAQQIAVIASRELEVRLRAGVALGGRVQDARGNPRAGLLVRALMVDAEEELLPSPRTDARGHYTFDAAPTGMRLEIFASTPAGARPTATVTLADGRSDVDLVLPATPSVFGTVLRPDGAPAAGMKLVVLADDVSAVPPRINGGPRRGGVSASWALGRTPTTVADEAGRYRFESLPPGEDYQVVALPSETQQERSAPFSLPPSGGSDVERNIRIRAAAELVLLLRYDDGKYLFFDGAIVLRSAAGSFHPDAGPMEGLPSFPPTFQNMTPGPYLLRVVVEGRPVHEQSIELVSGETISHTVTIARGLAIEGVVVDEEGNPLSHVALWWSPKSGGHPATTQTNNEGAFLLNGLAEGTGTLKAHYLARRIGSELGSTILEEVRAGQRGLRLVLSELGQIHARFPNLDAGTELSFEMYSESYGGMGTTLLGDHGSFEQPVPIANEPFLLVMRREGHAPLVVDRKAVAAGVDVELGSLRFHPGVTLRGVIQDDAGRPLPGARVRSAELWGSGARTTDSEGQFELERLPPRALCVLVSANGFPPHILCVDGTALDALETLQIGRGHELKGRVLLPSGKPASNATVYLSPASASRYGSDDTLIQSIECDAAGTFKGRFQAGRYELSANMLERSAAGSLIVDVTDDAAEVELQLRAR